MSSDPEISGAPRLIRPTDIGSLESVSDVAVHPNESDIAFVVSWPDLETDSNRAVLWAVTTSGKQRRRLTEGHHDSEPRFSPDGTALAFVRNEPGNSTVVMVMTWPTGELTEVARFVDGGVSHLRWLGDDRLVVLAPERPEHQEGVDDEELARRPRIVDNVRYRFNGRGYIHDRPMQIWLINLAAGAASSGASGKHDGPVAIGPAGVDHIGFALSPDGTRMVSVSFTDPDADLTGGRRVWMHSFDDGATSPLTDRASDWSLPVWLSDGRIWVSGPRHHGEVSFDRFYQFDPEGTSDPTPVTDGEDNIQSWGASGRAGMESGGAVLLHGVRRGRVAIDAYRTADGRMTTLYEDDCQALAFDASPSGDVLVAAITSPTRPAELWRIDDGAATRIVSLNDDLLAELDVAATEAVTVTAPDGAEVEGFVVRPPESAPDTGDLRPGLIYVHGGPMTQFGYRFFDEFQIAAACGYVVIGGNPRGSDGYGEKWARAIVGDFGDRDWVDVQALTDHLAGLEEVDAERIGIGGGSYGGFMTSWALGHDAAGRYTAGLVERAVTDWRSMYGTSDIGNWFTQRSIGATIEAELDEVLRQSPLTYAADITAPTLIIHSEEDWRCPIEQAEQLFTAIRRNGGDAVLVRFPGENHELSRSGQPRHRVERFEIIHEFYARHLGGVDYETSHLP